MVKQNRNPRLHARCGECDADLDPEVAVCTACGVPRPAKGWDVVAELRVYDRGPDPITPPSRPASRTSSHRAKERRPPTSPAWSQGSVYAKLVAVYGGSFAGTTFAVLGLWFIGTSGRATPPPNVPEAAAVVAPAAAPPIAPEPDPVDALGDDAIVDATALVDAVPSFPSPGDVDALGAPDVLAGAAVEATPAVEPVEPRRPAPAEPPPSRSRASVTPPADPGPPARVTAPEPEPPIVQPEPPVAPPAALIAARPAVPAPAKPPAAAARLTGTYVGKAAGRPVSIDLEFLAEGDLRVVARVNDGANTRTIDASGQYTLSSDGTATITFVERDVADPSVYSGTADGSVVDGRVTAGGKNKGRLLVAR